VFAAARDSLHNGSVAPSRLYEDRFHWVDNLAPDPIVRIVRSMTAFESAAEITESHLRLCKGMKSIQRRKTGLLIDIRLARPRNDPAFESAFEEARRDMQRGFARVAVVVGTPAGRLQARRYAKLDGRSDLDVFEDEATARAWLVSAIVNAR
jgi:hypothetical protein